MTEVAEVSEAANVSDGFFQMVRPHDRMLLLSSCRLGLPLAAPRRAVPSLVLTRAQKRIFSLTRLPSTLPCLNLHHAFRVR